MIINSNSPEERERLFKEENKIRNEFLFNFFAKQDNDVTGIRLVNGVRVPTQTREIVNANLLSVEAGTTGFRGGDSGHGGRTFFGIKDEGGTDIEVKRLTSDTGECMGFQVELGGDAELQSITESLEFILDTLKNKQHRTEDVLV